MRPIRTSNCGNPSLRLFGFGPVVPDGFGIGYIIKDAGFQYSISSKHRQTKRYANMLQRTLKDMGDLFPTKNSVQLSRQKSSLDEMTNVNIPETTSPRKLSTSSSFFASVRRRKKLDNDVLLHAGSNVGEGKK